MEKISSALRRLDLSLAQQDVYLSLLRTGRATARTLAARTNITRPSVYDQLKTLITLNLVVELDVDGKAYFAAADIKYLDALLADKIDRLEQSRSFLAEELPLLIGSLDTVTPKLRYFEGQEGMKQLLKDIMWHDKTTMQMFWIPEVIESVYNETFLRWFDERRALRQLKAQVLFQVSNDKYLPKFLNSDNDKTCRVFKKKKMPNVLMSYIIYDNKVSFISSTKEAFGFIVESSEFATLQRLQFETLWQAEN